MKHKKKEKYVQVCPKCGSIKIGCDTLILAYGGASLAPYCKDCGHKGFMPEVEESKIADFRKKLKEKKEKIISLKQNV